MSKGVEAVERALTILAAFHSKRKPLSLRDIAQETGLYKSTILRIIVSLENFGYLRRNPDGNYVLGPACPQLAATYNATFDLQGVLEKVITELSEKTGESVSFYVRDGDYRVCTIRQNSTRSVRHHVDEGARLPLDKGAAGKVLLAYSDSPAHPLDSADEVPFFISVGERDPDAAAISAPVFDAKGMLLGALTISGLKLRFVDSVIESLKIALREAVGEIERATGHKMGDKKGDHD